VACEEGFENNRSFSGEKEDEFFRKFLGNSRPSA
jgi:hypothetical protein